MRIARALFAAHMSTRSTFRGARLKRSVACMAHASDTLDNWFPNMIRSTGGRLHRQRRRGVAGELEMRCHRQRGWPTGTDLSNSGTVHIEALISAFIFGREPWAILASWVLTVDADGVRAEHSLAAVTGASYSDKNCSVDSRKFNVGQWFQSLRLQIQSISGQENACSFSLSGAAIDGPGVLGAGRG